MPLAYGPSGVIRKPNTAGRIIKQHAEGTRSTLKRLYQLGGGAIRRSYIGDQLLVKEGGVQIKGRQGQWERPPSPRQRHTLWRRDCGQWR